ncbi:MAG: carbon-nitrogen hydrolase family protein [Nocardioides sp.]
MEVVLVQAASTLEPAENRARLTDLVPDGADLVVLPEAFARDFGEPGSDLRGVAEPIPGPFTDEVERLAAERHTTVVAGMFESAGERPFNTVVVRGAAHADYRKIHLYDSFGYRESDQTAPGSLTPTAFDLGGLRLGLLTCYDLRFPEQARALVAGGVEVLLVPSAWVAGPRKVDHWTTLARARAIENTAYVVAVGQPGPRYTGHSLVVDPWGEVLVEAGDGEQTLRATLSPEVLEEARAANPSLGNRRL